MKLSDYVKNIVYKMLGLQKLSNNPNNDRLTLINNDDEIRIAEIRANKIWYIGNASELLNYYTGQDAFGFIKNPIYNRNNVNGFWGKSALECGIHRIHSGIPKAIVDSISYIVGVPIINGSDPRIEELLEVNDFYYKLANVSRPMTLSQGDGCWKWSIMPGLADYPILEYYEAEDWEPIEKNGILLGLIFKNYYKNKKGKDFILIETRRLEERGCIIEYALYKLEKGNDLSKVDFTEIPELAHYADVKNQRLLLPGVKRLFATPVKYFYNPLRKLRGKSLYDGKIELFDLLDETLSQEGQTIRVSTPVEYYDTMLLKRTPKGQPILPNIYNRQFVAIEGKTNGDGQSKNAGIITTQPELNFEKFSMAVSDLVNNILIGIESPASLGIDISRKDNAEAQREKEKQTIFTRNTIIDRETKQDRDVVEQGIILYNYMQTGQLVDTHIEISIKYDEFANPSFESLLTTLGPAWSQGQISTERYVQLLWAGKMSDEEMAQEIAWLDNNKQQDNFDMDALMGHENAINEGLSGEGQSEEPAPKVKE